MNEPQPITVVDVDMPFLSRYQDTPVVRLPANRFIEFALWVSDPRFVNDGGFVMHTVTDYQVGRLDLISHEHYGTPMYWWCIAATNGIIDAIYEMEPGTFLKVPSMSVIERYLQRGAKS